MTLECDLIKYSEHNIILNQESHIAFISKLGLERSAD